MLGGIYVIVLYPGRSAIFSVAFLFHLAFFSLAHFLCRFLVFAVIFCVKEGCCCYCSVFSWFGLLV